VNPNDDQVLARLRDYYAAHRVLPSFSHIQRLLGMSSKSRVAEVIARLREAGFLGMSPERRLCPTPRFFERAVLGPVRAGLPEAATEGASEHLNLDAYLIRNPSRTELVRVRGDSMDGAGIRDGDLAVVERLRHARVGDIVVAIVDSEFTVKYLARERDKHVLKPAHPDYPVIHPRGALEIYGVVVGIVRKLIS
jgi:repressor LexA